MQRLEGVIRNYDWGSTSSIPSMLGCAEDGKPWDLIDPKKVRKLMELIEQGEPFVVIGSPPCTEFSSVQNYCMS